MNENEKFAREVNAYIEQYINLNAENIKNKINDMIEKAQNSEKKYLILHPTAIIEIDNQNIGEEYKKLRECSIMGDYSLTIEIKIKYTILNEILKQIKGIYTFNKLFIFKSFIVTWKKSNYFTQLLRFKIFNAQC